MIRVLWSFIKLVLALILALAIAFGIFYLVTVVYQQSELTAIGIIAGILGILVFSYFLVTFLRRLRQKRFVEKIVAQDDLLLRKARNDEVARLTDLRERWLAAVAAMRGSSLRKKGNPLYVLPWYLIFGETDSGKSSSIGHCGLNSAIPEVGPVPGVASTRNCDWWFFENAVIIDTAGKYAVPVDGKIDETEWKEFLVQVASYRRREPINGIMATLPMDKLAFATEDDLEKYAVFISERVARLARVLGARIPVYLTVTKTDLLTGFSSLQSFLSPEEKDGAFGYTSSVEESHSAVVDHVFDSVRQGIFSLIMTGDGEASPRRQVSEAKAGALLFMENFLCLRERLRLFVRTAFSGSAYREKTLLRGIYLTSALQTGESRTLFAPEFVRSSEARAAFGGRGMFLKDIFIRIMPDSRGLYQPLAEFLRWRTISGNLALISLGLFTVAFGVYLGYCASYSEQQCDVLARAIRNVQIHGITRESRLDAQHMLLEDIRDTVSSLNYRLQLPLTRQSLDASLDAARRYLVNSYREHTMSDLLSQDYWEKRIAENRRQAALEDDASESDNLISSRDEALGDALLFFSLLDRYYNLKTGTLNRDKKLREQFHSRFMMISGNNINCGNYDRNRCQEILEAYMDYQDNYFKEADYCSSLKDTLNRLLKENHDFKWIASWASSKVPAIRVGAFLPTTRYPQTQYNFGGTFTIMGSNYIDAMLDSLPDDSSYVNMELKKKIFHDYFTSNFIMKWVTILENFESAAEGSTLAERRSVAPFLADLERNPFFQLYDRAYDELSFIAKKVPVNIDYMTAEQIAVYNYSVLQSQNGSVLEKIRQGAGHAKKMAENIDIASVNAEVKDKIDAAATATHDYFESLREAASADLTDRQALSLAAASGGEKTSDHIGIFVKLRKSLADVERILSPSEEEIRKGGGRTRVVSGSFPYVQTVNYLTHMILDSAGCALQQKWTDEVVSRLTDDHVELFSDQGLVTKFLKEDLQGFITATAGGYQPVEIRGMKIKFTPAFVSFLNRRGVYRRVLGVKDLKLTVSTSPFLVNDDARTLPNAAVVTFHCQEKDHRLANYNFNTSLTFQWKKDECEGATLDIDFDGFTLRKNFDGPNGIADFFTLFQSGGYHDFAPWDFPGKENIMDALNVQWIRLYYKSPAADTVIRSADYSKNSLGVPDQAVECD